MLEKLKNVGGKLNTKKIALVTSLSALTLCGTPLAAADAGTIVTNAVGQILELVSYVGVILAVWGLVQFFLAVKNEDSDSKARAGMTIVCGAGLVGIRVFINALGIGSF